VLDLRDGERPAAGRCVSLVPAWTAEDQEVKSPVVRRFRRQRPIARPPSGQEAPVDTDERGRVVGMSSDPQGTVGGSAGEDEVPAGDLGAGGPADDRGDGEAPASPPGYPDEVDPAEGPLGPRRDGHLGDLEDPGAPAST